MKKNLLNNYISVRLNSAKKHLATYRKKKDTEQIHAFRVDVKKIKAVLSFAESVYKEKYNCRVLATAFKKAGEIREFQINIQLLRKLSRSNSKLISCLKTRQHALELQFAKNSSNYLEIIRKFKNTISLPAKLPKEEKIKKYFKKKIRKADKKLLARDREQLHLFRKKVKEILYVNTLLPKKLQKSIGIDPLRAHKIQEQTGEWHDSYSAIYFFSHSQFPVSTVKAISLLKTNEKKQFKALASGSFLLKNTISQHP